VWHDERYTLYAVNGARPRAYVANGVVPVSDAASALAALDRLHVPGSDAVVETVNALTSTGGTARITTDRPGEITVRVSAASQGLVVLNEAYGDGGWRATVDGATQPILRANYLYQGVVIPAGDHTVRFTYRPTAFVAGAAVSAGSMIGVLVLVFVDLVGRRRMKAGR
jgi:hypothetical protein